MIRPMVFGWGVGLPVFDYEITDGEVFRKHTNCTEAGH